MTARVISIPAETPEELTTAPSSTQRACLTQFTLGPGAVESLKAILFVVAGLPSRMPAAAKSDAPLHTDMTIFVLVAWSRSQFRVAVSLTRGTAPMPPGTSR